MVTIYYGYTDIVRNSSLNLFIEELSPRTQEKLARLQRREDQDLLVTSFVLLSNALHDNGFDAFRLCDVLYSLTGRPFIPDAPFDFNISHTGTCAALAFSEHCRVGIDVEKIQEIDFSDFTEYFTSALWDDIHAAQDACGRFFYFWTLFESGVKADGRGLSLVSAKRMQVDDGMLFIDGVKWFYHHHIFDPSISCCVTTALQSSPHAIKFITSLPAVQKI